MFPKPFVTRKTGAEGIASVFIFGKNLELRRYQMKNTKMDSLTTGNVSVQLLKFAIPL